MVWLRFQNGSKDKSVNHTLVNEGQKISLEKKKKKKKKVDFFLFPF